MAIAFFNISSSSFNFKFSFFNFFISWLFVELDKEIKEEYEKSKGRYGSPKIQKILEKRGIRVSQKRIARRMKEMGLRSITVKKFRASGSKGKVDDTNKPNLSLLP